MSTSDSSRCASSIRREKKSLAVELRVIAVALKHFGRKQLKKTDKVALEATTNTWPVVEILRPYLAEVVVGNPLKTKAIAEAKIKTDKVDAMVLAHLMRCDYLPDVWQPDDQTQILRGLITHRTGLMTQRGR